MEKLKLYILSVLAISLTTVGCTDDFENLNRDPSAVIDVQPEELFYMAETNVLSAAHCWNSIYAAKFRWMQYGSGIWGYSLTNYDYFQNSIGNSIYYEYNQMGSYVTNIEYVASKTDTPENYSDLIQAGRILLIAKGIQTSDMFGSLAYSQAWLAKKGLIDDESMSPEFETQEELSDIWDKQLKECISTLKANLNSSSQKSLKGYDRSYNGDMKKWIKAANGIRLRLASRLWKRQPEIAKSIATEVLSPSNSEFVFNTTDDSFILWFDNLYTNIHEGDWHSIRDMEIASYAFMDYLNKNEDPRRKIFFKKNNLTPENVEEFNKAQTDTSRLIPANYTRWEGSTISYDKWNDDRPRARYYLTKDKEQIDMRPANTPQSRLWKGNDDTGNGGNWAPVMTYADFCFLSAEWVLREGIPSSKSAQEWYEDGVKASLAQWSEVGKYCDVIDYEEITQEEIDAFMQKEDVKWNQSIGLEQIYAQTYVEHYKNVDEMYAFWKRTNYPNWEGSKIIQFEEPVIQGVKRIIPRRVKFVYPNPGVHNAENLIKRIDVMKEDPQFGDESNEYGRLWWDVK